MHPEKVVPECKEPARWVPVIDRNRCEAKGPCVEACPYDVFEVQPLKQADRDALSLFGKVKAWAHGNQQAYVIDPDACRACGLCVKACPEKAIKLRKVA